MKNLIIQASLFLALLVCFNTELTAQDFSYKAKNPAFGGSYLNYSWLQSSAQIQDKTEDPNKEDFRIGQRDPLEDFSRSLNRSLLSRLSRQLLTDQFGEDGLQEGNYIIGDYQIDVLPTDEGITITIIDSATGGETQIVVPHF
jgi:curli production assembly/transport component CsgF